MRTGDTKIFLDKRKLYVMVSLRLNGWSSSSLASLYGCHRSSIDSQLKKYHLDTIEGTFYLDGALAFVLSNLVTAEPKWDVVDGEVITRGKTYKEYVKDSELPSLRLRVR